MYDEQMKREPNVTTCPKCGGNMLSRGVSKDVAFFRHPGDSAPWSGDHLSMAMAKVCDNCGYAEIYATNPDNLRD